MKSFPVFKVVYLAVFCLFMTAFALAVVFASKRLEPKGQPVAHEQVDLGE